MSLIWVPLSWLTCNLLISAVPEIPGVFEGFWEIHWDQAGLWEFEQLQEVIDGLAPGLVSDFFTRLYALEHPPRFDFYTSLNYIA